MSAKTSLAVALISFGYRHGPPPESADIVMDVRFLKNPHWDEALRPGTGRDRAVGDYIEQDPNFRLFTERFTALLGPLLPLYAQGERKTLTIALGCTGGRHRSVYAVETLKAWLESQSATVTVAHRDIEKS